MSGVMPPYITDQHARFFLWRTAVSVVYYSSVVFFIRVSVVDCSLCFAQDVSSDAYFGLMLQIQVAPVLSLPRNRTWQRHMFRCMHMHIHTLRGGSAVHQGTCIYFVSRAEGTP